MFFENCTGLDDLCWYLLFNKLQMSTLSFDNDTTYCFIKRIRTHSKLSLHHVYCVLAECNNDAIENLE